MEQEINQTKMTRLAPPRLLIPVESRWLSQADDELKHGKKKLYFGTDSSSYRDRDIILVKTILFKIKGDDYASMTATLIDLLTHSHPRAEERLWGKSGTLYALYYSFDHLRDLPANIPLSSLRYYSTGTPISNTARGCCIVD